MNTSRVRALSAFAAVLLVVCAGPSTATTGANPHRGSGAALSVEGYVFGSHAGTRAYLSDARAVDVVGVDGVTLTRDADGIATLGAGATGVLAAAHHHGDSAEFLVSNYSDSLGDFDPALAHTMLGSPAHRRQVAQALAAVVRHDGWDGVQLDLESLVASDRPGLASFVRALRVALPAGTTISMAVMAERSVAAYRRHGYPLARLGAVDRFVLMAYDQHGPGWSGPGPVGALPWARRTARALVSAVGVARVDLGIAGYGYLWTSPTTGRQVSDARARALADGHGTWHPRQGEWSAHLSGGRTLWWSDARSYSRRTALARALGLHGVAVWQLGSADRLRG